MNATVVPPESPARATASERRRAKPRCEHCGATVPEGERFCCGGCAFVSRLIREEGLDAYYEFKAAVTPSAEAALLPAGDFAWLADAARVAEAKATESGGAAELELAIQGLSCAACVWLIERLFARRPGAGGVEVSAETGRMRLRWVAGGGFDAAEFARELQRFNYQVGPADSAREAEPESRGLARKTGLAGALAMNAMLFTLPYYFGMSEHFEYARLFETLSLVFATLSVFGCGAYFLTRAAAAMRARLVHLDLPIALGIVGAYLGSAWGWVIGDAECQYFDFVTGFIFLMLLGRWAQVAAVERNQRQLLREQPEAARVRVRRGAECEWTEAGPETLVAGERFAVAAGAMVPVEARLETAEAEFSLAWITGEAEPRLFRLGQRVPAGAGLAGRGEVELTATQAWAGSLLAELTRPAERAPERARLIERVVKWYLVGILGAATLAGIWWGWATGDAGRTGAVVISILVVSCPCALGLAFPLVEELATVRLRRRGVFLRAGDLWQRLARVRAVVFDKTGTLTHETPALREPEALARLNITERAALMALVRDNPHPVGRALHEAMLLRGWSEALAGEVTEEVGRGVRLGDWTLERSGVLGADTVLMRNGRVVARFSFVDAVRTDARAELAALGRRGLGLAVLSGDRSEKVAKLADELGLKTEWARGELTPREKADWLAAHGGDAALMLGDGANDSLAFDAALCRGTPAIHRGTLAGKADFYYLGRGIGGVRALLEMNDARRSTQAALLVFMIAYNLTAVGLAATGHMNPLFAAVLMPLSSLATLAIVWIGLRRAR